MRNRLWKCSLGHTLDDDGFHIVSDQERVHGKVTVPPSYSDEPLPEPPPTRLVHTVNVVHTHKPRPRPNMIAYIVNDPDGRQYRTAPVNVYGQAVMPVQIPIAWMTGRDQDIALPPVNIKAEFWYPEES